MAIQTINLTVPGGDTPRSANTKINANFTNSEHAASKLVGAATGNIPLVQDVYNAAYARIDDTHITFTPEQLDGLANGTRVVVPDAAIDSPLSSSDTSFLVETKTMSNHHGRGFQEATGIFFGDKLIRMCGPDRVWKEWQSATTQRSTYRTTTAIAPNVAVATDGALMRNTSSERYKDIIADLELDDDQYADAMSLNPIVYRSKAEADNPNHHFYSFSAEALGAHDPAFTLWRDTETVIDDEGNVTEQPLDERVAEGINLNTIVAFLHATNIKQGELIKDLQDQVIEQREAIAALQQANP